VAGGTSQHELNRDPFTGPFPLTEGISMGEAIS
jgi:hypothetical protein